MWESGSVVTIEVNFKFKKECQVKILPIRSLLKWWGLRWRKKYSCWISKFFILDVSDYTKSIFNSFKGKKKILLTSKNESWMIWIIWQFCDREIKIKSKNKFFLHIFKITTNCFWKDMPIQLSLKETSIYGWRGIQVYEVQSCC